MPKKNTKQPLSDDITELQAQVTKLKKQIYELQIRKRYSGKSCRNNKKRPGHRSKKAKE